MQLLADFFLFDANQRIVYRGQLDDSRPSKGAITLLLLIKNRIESSLNLKLGECDLLISLHL